MLHVNHEFCLHMAERLRPGGRYLDYGCGGGEVVLAGRERGLDIYGSEVFFEGGGPQNREAAVSTGLLGTHVLPMNEGRLPFPDGHFDFVFHNQVFEHVPDIDLALREISRTMRPNGLMLSIFPSREILWDPHCRMPFIHWFNRESKVGFAWLVTLRRLGLGVTHSASPPNEWARHYISYIHDWCHYRPLDELAGAYRHHGFTFESHEMDYVAFRLNFTGQRQWIPLFGLAEPLTRRLLHRLGGIVILSSGPPEVLPVETSSSNT